MTKVSAVIQSACSDQSIDKARSMVPAVAAKINSAHGQRVTDQNINSFGSAATVLLIRAYYSPGYTGEYHEKYGAPCNSAGYTFTHDGGYESIANIQGGNCYWATFYVMTTPHINSLPTADLRTTPYSYFNIRSTY